MADMTSGYSLSDIKAIVGDSDEGGFGGNNGWWIILLFLFFLGFGGNTPFGGKNNNGLVAEQAATQSSLDTLSASINEKTLLAAIDGNNAAIQELSKQVGCADSQVQAAIAGVKSAVEQASAQTNLNICQLGNAIERGDASIINTIQSCCCSVKTELLTQFNALDKTLCQMQYNNQTALNNINMGVANGFIQTQNIANQNTASIIAAGNANTQRIVDLMNINKMEDLKEQLFKCSQTSQTNQILAAINAKGNCGCCNTTSCC